MRTGTSPTRKVITILLLLILSGPAVTSGAESIFTPGSVYREYRVNPADIKDGWRVTSPTSTSAGAQAFLPNPVLSIEGVELEDAISAEVEIDFWSGHHGTRGKQMRINESGWINLPERLAGTRGFTGDYLAEYNMRISLPLHLLNEGRNEVQGTSRNNEWGWGQWGWYTIVLRVFYDSEKVEHPSVELVLPQTEDEGTVHKAKAFEENPRFQFKTQSKAGIRQIDLLAAFEGVDENGDGIYYDYHGMQRPDGLEGHVGTAREAPWEIIWDTTWVPDQAPESISLLPRICDKNGVWTVGNVTEGCSLIREDHSVRLLISKIQPVIFWVRNGRMASCVVEINDKNISLKDITAAAMYMRSWNVQNNEQGYTPFRINSSPWMNHISGPSHAYHSDYYTIPVGHLQTGHNLLTFSSTTVHHGCEFLWPGPDVLVKIIQSKSE